MAFTPIVPQLIFYKTHATTSDFLDIRICSSSQSHTTKSLKPNMDFEDYWLRTS